jgi:intraflagellar transport protein 80
MKEDSTTRKISLKTKPAHTDCVSCLGWSGNNELLTFGDDRKVSHFAADAEPLPKLQTNLFDTPAVKPGSEAPPSLHVTEMHWFPSTGKAQANSEIFVLGGSDGIQF